MAGGQDVNERQRLGKGPFGRPGRLPASVCHLSLLITPHLPMPLRLLCLSVLCLCSVVASAETSWIWGAKNNVAKQEVWFRTSFELKEVPAKALLQAAADNHCVVWLNGKALGGSDDWAEAFNAEVGGDLKVGVNTIAVLARNDGGIAALSFRLTAGPAVLAESGTNWKTSLAKPGKGWENAGFDDASWAAATFVKKYGEQPWGKPFDRQAAVAKSGKRTPSTSVAAPEELILQPGFKAELLHLVPKAEQGTWVSLAVSPEGDLVAGDQGGVLWRVSLKDPSKPARPFLMFGYKSFQKAFNDGRWKLIRYPHVDRTQLFDLQADPYETKDLAAQPEYAERIKGMLAKLGTEMKADGDNDPLTAAKIVPAEWKAPTKVPKPGQKGF